VAGDDQVLGSETMIEALREARTRSAIKAVVLRIDSPGGDVRASDDIWSEVERLSAVKPVIVSMSDVAASGGYYIAAPAQRIVAQPATITGSIGVYGGKLNILGLYRKLGLNVETVTRGTHAEMMSPFRDFTPDERDRYQAQIDASYRLFLNRVSEGRGLSLEAVDSVGQGRIWSGVDAQAIGLVDTLGGLETAIALAARAGGLDPHHPIERLPRVEHPWYERWLDEMIDGSQRGLGLIGRAGTSRASGLDARSAVEAAVLPAVTRAWLAASRLHGGGLWALLPVSIEIH
jgi:protease-4